jgi:two-component system sensor histidine kinase HydH
MIPMQYYRGLVFLAALLLTCIAIYNKISVHGIALRSSDELLKSRGSFIWITLAKSLRVPPFNKDLFAAAARKHFGDQVAYVALYDANGAIILHTDSRLIGTASDEPRMGEASRREEPQAGLRRFADGTTLYVFDMGIETAEMDSKSFLLRVALHPASALADVQQAKRHIILSISLIVFLWLLAWFFYRFSRRIDMLRCESMEKEHLAMLGEMAAVVAHEIRSPLSAIKGFSQYLAEKERGNPACEEEGYRVIINETIRLELLTDDLLGYARVDKVQPVQFSLLELVDEVWSLITPDNSRITITKEISAEDDLIYSDREKLRRILMNVLQNSIDAIDNKGIIGIKAIDCRGKMTLSIRDSGKGMDENTIKQAFKPFFTTKVKGTGLGLAIVEKNVTSLSGKVKIASKMGMGTTITIVMPGHRDGQKPL